MRDYLSKLTVKDLRELAKRLGFKGYSSLKKDLLVAEITMTIDMVHGEALEMNEAFKPEITYTIPDTDITLTGQSAVFLINHDRRVRRYNPSFRRAKNGTVVLTAKQRRRIAKKDRREFYGAMDA
jgi:hypothetical protein